MTRGGVALRPAPCAMEGRVASAHGYHQMGPHEILRLSTQRERALSAAQTGANLVRKQPNGF